MQSNQVQEQVTLGPQGRLVVPARYRQALKLHAGERLIMRIVDGALILERPAAVQERLRARFQKVNKQGKSLAAELIADRRKEGHRESRGR